MNAAAKPAAAPTGAINRTFLARQRNRRPSAEAMPAPICSEGSSGPSDCPVPMASAQVTNFPMTVLKGMIAVVNVHGGFGLVHAAAPRAGKKLHHQKSHHQPDDGRHQQHSPRRDDQTGTKTA